MPGDTIVALATPPGRGGVGVVRLSGPAAEEIGTALLGTLPEPRRAELRGWRGADGEPIDVGLVLYFPAPASFTGEAVLELHGHGGPVVLDQLVSCCIMLGARPARPGEFSERAFLNGKLDLAQAEAIADLIDSGSALAARAALRSLQGAFSQRVSALVEALTGLRVHVEATIDFPEEEIDFLADGEILGGLDKVAAELAAVRTAARRGQVLRDGLTVVIAGPPNAGKSSLLNHFAGCDSAIVTPYPGTTRDLLREFVELDGLPLHLVDTAGLRDASDPVEEEGIRRAREQIANADRVLLMVDDQSVSDETLVRLRGACAVPQQVTLVRNKIDLSGRRAGLRDAPLGVEIAISLRTGAGLDLLREHLKSVSGYACAETGVYSARRRHLTALEEASAALERARHELLDAHAGELVAEELRLAQQALGEITGEVTSEALLGRIFASFCIGK
jgi:tRNA modification GTPase